MPRAGTPLTTAERAAISSGHQRRKALGLPVGRAPRALGPHEVTLILFKAVGVAARRFQFGPARLLLGPPPLSAGPLWRWNTARQVAMYFGRRHRVPDLISAQMCGWTEAQICAAVAAVQGEAVALQELWNSDRYVHDPRGVNVGTGTVAASHPLLEAGSKLLQLANVVEEPSTEGRKMLDGVIRGLENAARKIKDEIAEKQQDLLRIAAAIKTLNRETSSSRSKVTRGQADERRRAVLVALGRYPKGAACGEIAAVLKMASRPERNRLNTLLWTMAKRGQCRSLGQGRYAPLARVKAA